MTFLCNKAAFTLMEMLLVVLIVGILTAVALPMYQRAVYKSRFSKLMLPAKSLASANEAFFLANGEYSELPAQLDVGSDTATLPDGSSILLSTDDTVSFVRLANATEVPNARYVVYQQRSANFAGTTMCESLDTDDRATWLCSKGLNGTKVDSGNSGAEAGWSAYILTGTAGQNDQFAAIGNNNNDPGEEPTEPTELEPQTPAKPTCGGVEQPDDIQVDGNPATGTASCVNGQWKYTWTGGNVYDTNYSNWTTVCEVTSGEEYKCAGSTFSGRYTKCDAYFADGCADSTFSGNNSRCDGNAANGCAGSIFSGRQSNCYGGAANGCAGSIFSGEYSSCDGYAANGCAGSTFSGNHSHCYGRVTNGCAGVIIQAGAYCTAAQNSGGCDGAKYGIDPTGQHIGIGSCNDWAGNCPIGVPINNLSWNETNGSYDITGWKGNCCNPAYMVSGECPSGITVCGS